MRDFIEDLIGAICVMALPFLLLHVANGAGVDVMTNNTHPCDYAFPVAPGDEPYWQPGMTLRDWFAGQALSGDMTTYPDNDAAEYAQEIAKRCYAVADAMLAARAKGGA